MSKAPQHFLTNGLTCPRPSLLFLAAYFPTPDGQIAPGMHCAYTVQFTPDSLADYKEDLTVSRLRQAVSSWSKCRHVSWDKLTSFRAERAGTNKSFGECRECWSIGVREERGGEGRGWDIPH